MGTKWDEKRRDEVAESAQGGFLVPRAGIVLLARSEGSKEKESAITQTKGDVSPLPESDSREFGVAFSTKLGQLFFLIFKNGMSNIIKQLFKKITLMMIEWKSNFNAAPQLK